jgi:hypothetical protein
MTFSLLRLVVVVVVWWAALWFALPVDLQQLSVPELVSWHLGPPLLAVAVWSLFKRFRAWSADDKIRAEEAAREAEQQAKLDADKAASEAELAQRRAHVECRGAWIFTLKMPEWYKFVSQCFLEGEDAGRVCKAGWDEALAATGRRVFESVLQQSAALAWLPVYTVPGRNLDSSLQMALLQRVWRDTIDAAGLELSPSRADCKFLPGTGTIIERVIALFDNDPMLPALLLVGFDSPLAVAKELPGDEKAARSPDRPGHAVAAVVLSRPGLALPEGLDAALTQEAREANPYTPYWEREQEKIAIQVMGRVPLPLQPDLLALEPFAALGRPRSLTAPRARQVSALLAALLIDAGLRDPLPENHAEAEESESPDKSAEAEEGEGKAEEKGDAVEFGWLVHNGGGTEDFADVKRIAAVTEAVQGFCEEFEPQQDVSNVGIEYGETGAARSVLMLAEGLMRVAQLQKPVLIAEYGEGGNKLEIGLARLPQPVDKA